MALHAKLRSHLGDITKLAVDAIVNAANPTLRGGGGVDGAIHAAAGPELLAECSRIGPCPTGDARLTRGYSLPAGHVIHAVGPVWRGGAHGEADFLAGCYERALEIANAQQFRSIAFPSISTGAFGYPLEPAARIAIDTVRRFVKQPTSLEDVIFCCFSPEDLSVYDSLLFRIVR